MTFAAGIFIGIVLGCVVTLVTVVIVVAGSTRDMQARDPRSR